MTSKNQHSTTSNTSFYASITEAAKIEKIVDYSFERNEKSNVLAIHPTRPIIAYLINIQRTQKISKAWTSGHDSSTASNDQSSSDKNKTVSIRIIDYVTRQRCLAKGIYHARPADCVFTINSLLCTQGDVIKLAVVDRLANVYLYDLSYFINDLTATRIAVIRGPAQNVSPYESISLVWCPFVPCEDFDDGDGGLRLALATDSKIEIFAVDRLQGKTGELQRSDLKGAYKCINDAHKTNIVTLSISPDCSTISAAASDNRVTFFSSDIDDSAQRCLHNWEAGVTDKSSISKLFFLDDYPKLLEDSTMKFWGAAFIGTKSGQMFLVDLRTWTVYQRSQIASETSGSKNFDYRIDLTSRNVIAINGNQCYVVQIEHEPTKSSPSAAQSVVGATQSELNSLDLDSVDMMNGNIFSCISKSAVGAQRSSQKPSNKRHTTTNSTSKFDGLPLISRTTRLGLHNPIYSFVIKHKSDDEHELFTISAYSLERYIIDLNAINSEALEDIPMSANEESKPVGNTPQELTRFLQQFDGSLRISSSGAAPNNNTLLTNNNDSSLLNTSVTPARSVKQEMDLFKKSLNENSSFQNQETEVLATLQAPAPQQVSSKSSSNAVLLSKNDGSSLDVNQMDRMVEALFTKLNTTFSQGLEEFLNDVKCEVNDLLFYTPCWSDTGVQQARVIIICQQSIVIWSSTR